MNELLKIKSDIYNELYGTEYTPETYDDARKKVECVIAWDQGWDAGTLAVSPAPLPPWKEAGP